MKSPLPALATAFLALLACGSAFAGLADRTLDIYWVDVEGGGATLIVTPAGESVLIDSGNPFERDPGRIHKLATEVAGLKKIDHLVTTHFHDDHFGGAAELSALIPIGQVHDKGIPETDPDNRPNDALATWSRTRKFISAGVAVGVCGFTVLFGSLTAFSVTVPTHRPAFEAGAGFSAETGTRRRMPCAVAVSSASLTAGSPARRMPTSSVTLSPAASDLVSVVSGVQVCARVPSSRPETTSG